MSTAVREDGKTDGKPCPLCSVATSSSNTTSSSILTLRQINFSEAIYVCSNPECVYPVGDELVVVKRDVSQLLQASHDTTPQATGTYASDTP